MKKKRLFTLEELDKFSLEVIKIFRYNILTTYQQTEIELQYLKELDFYMAVRFKQDELDRFNRWKREVEEADKIGNKDIDIGAKRLITDIGFEQTYFLGLVHDIHEIGEFKYIKNIPYDIPEQYMKIEFKK